MCHHLEAKEEYKNRWSGRHAAGRVCESKGGRKAYRLASLLHSITVASQTRPAYTSGVVHIHTCVGGRKRDWSVSDCLGKLLSPMYMYMYMCAWCPPEGNAGNLFVCLLVL